MSARSSAVPLLAAPSVAMNLAARLVSGTRDLPTMASAAAVVGDVGAREESRVFLDSTRSPSRSFPSSSSSSSISMRRKLVGVAPWGVANPPLLESSLGSSIDGGGEGGGRSGRSGAGGFGDFAGELALIDRVPLAAPIGLARSNSSPSLGSSPVGDSARPPGAIPASSRGENAAAWTSEPPDGFLLNGHEGGFGSAARLDPPSSSSSSSLANTLYLATSSSSESRLVPPPPLASSSGLSSSGSSLSELRIVDDDGDDGEAPGGRRRRAPGGVTAGASISSHESVTGVPDWRSAAAGVHASLSVLTSNVAAGAGSVSSSSRGRIRGSRRGVVVVVAVAAGKGGCSGESGALILPIISANRRCFSSSARLLRCSNGDTDTRLGAGGDAFGSALGGVNPSVKLRRRPLEPGICEAFWFSSGEPRDVPELDAGLCGCASPRGDLGDVG
mmetsp:Transcript_7656/g.31051  ORF Transcript_7656/g.31051 Transcript_7656/m.31051 type:complete len:445 (-) Transcript_7656:257-1591(-)